jgi:hypothetical protein
MTWGFVSETSDTNNVKNKCWVTVAVIVGLIILVFIMNDFCTKKYKKSQKNVRFDEHEEDYNKVNNIMNKRQCSLNK